MRSRHYALFGILFAVFALSAVANVLNTATATADCSGYTLTVNARDLSVGSSYTINYTFTLNCGGSITTVPGTISFTATASTVSKTVTVNWPNSPLSKACTVTGSAVLTASGSLVPITFNSASSLELNCGGTGCPATIGFWKNEKKHPFPNSVETSGLTIGGVTYSASELQTILNNNGGNAVTILGKQLVGALLNIAAGAKHNATADGAISTAEMLLKANKLNLLNSYVAPSTALGQALLVQANILDGYNGADFNKCPEGSGLTLGD